LRICQDVGAFVRAGISICFKLVLSLTYNNIGRLLIE
jgi:hypothetical protein